MRVMLCSLSTMLGGVELRMGLEARLLKRFGHSPSIAINRHAALADWAERLERDGIPVVDFDPPPYMEDFWWLRRLPPWSRSILRRAKFEHKAWRIARSINKIRSIRTARLMFTAAGPHLIHIFIPWSGFEASRLHLAHCNGLPVILSVRNAFSKNGWSPWHRRHYSEAFHSVRGIYAISQGALDHFMSLYGDFVQPHTFRTVIHNSVDTVRFAPDPTKRAAMRKKLKLPIDALVAGFVGRIEKQKRPEALIDVFAALKKRFENLYLVIVGSGPLEQNVRNQAAKLGVSDSVIFTGWQLQVEDFIPGFDVVLQLSRNEGFGTSTAEAMACGVPVVGTDVPGTRDILKAGRGGVLVPLNDGRAAVQACARILSDPTLRCGIGEEARMEAIQHYDEKVWERNILNFYTRVSGLVSLQ